MKVTEQGHDRVAFYKLISWWGWVGQIEGEEGLVANPPGQAWADRVGLPYGDSDENREKVRKTGETSKKALMPLRKQRTLLCLQSQTQRISSSSVFQTWMVTPLTETEKRRGEPCTGSERGVGGVMTRNLFLHPWVRVTADPWNSL